MKDGTRDQYEAAKDDRTDTWIIEPQAKNEYWQQTVTIY